MANHTRFQPNYLFTLALDPEYGIITDSSSLSPDFLTRNPNLFKAKKGNDPDTPGIVEALTGQYREEFLEAMKNEVEELEAHKTWEVIKREDIPVEKDKDGNPKQPKVLSGTWAFKIKHFPSGLLRKIKARFCARGDLQEDVNVYETYAPVASWSSIRMLTITGLQRGWVTKQIDFSNAFVQAPMTRSVYVSLPAMFTDTNGTIRKDLCLKLNKSLYGLREAPKHWSNWLAKGLYKCGLTPSDTDPGIYYGRGMALAVYVDAILLFGPDEKEMNKVLEELKLDGFNLKIEKKGVDKTYDFLGINVTQENKEENIIEVKLTQLGLIKKFLECVGMLDCKPSPTSCTIQPLGTDANGKDILKTGNIHLL